MKITSWLKPALVLGLIAGTALAGTAASAAPLLTESFETPALTAPAIQYGPDEVSYNTNVAGAASVANVTFSGFSGLITSGALGIFNPTPDGNQSAFVQAYGGNSGSEIQWQVSGLTPGKQYSLSFLDAGSLVVPTATFTVAGLGLTPTSYTPGTAFESDSLYFTAPSASGTISFTVLAGPGNVATAIDALSITAVPEPATWALMLVGMGMIGFATRRRARATVSHA